MSHRAFVVVALCALIACKTDDPGSKPPPSPPPSTPPPSQPPQPSPTEQPPPEPCTVHDVELVYVLSSKNELYSFNPQKLPEDPFRLVGKIGCGLGSPNSMAVDHAGIAWVVDHRHTLYRVSILDARCSNVGSYATDAGAELPDTFGMGFVSDGKRTETHTAETLFVAADASDGPSSLGAVDTSTVPPRYRRIAAIEARGKGNPELSGTGDGALYGYFPSKDRDGFVQGIDPATGGAVGKRYPVPTDGEVGAWAFAHWGGTFYVFTTAADNSQIHAIDRKTGTYQLVRDGLPFRIVGAGVSTCAPVLERG